MGGWTPLEWLVLIERELLIFACVFFLAGALDELAIDLTWLSLRWRRKAETRTVDHVKLHTRPLSGHAAVLIPTWREASVITFTIAHARVAWPQPDLRIYVGCYANDPETVQAVKLGARGDPRVHVVQHAHEGPTTKADCLNHLYAAIEHDERRSGREFRMIVLHDAEDMVDPAALALLDGALDEADFVQLPVLPEPQRHSRWIGSHYCDEFAEEHGKAMRVREALAAGVPSAGVGCAISRPMLRKLVSESTGGPFAVESLTEDYELGLRLKAAGARPRFLRARGTDGHLIATRACFPTGIKQAVRQKARWIHGIAFQGWDRLGWKGGIGERWMRVRDRKGPLTAVVLLAGYLLLMLGGAIWIAGKMGFVRPGQTNPLLDALIAANFASLVWRIGMRCAFTARHYGWREGLRAAPRVVVSNAIAILAARDALRAYVRSLRGEQPQWNKTVHHVHPVALVAEQRSA